MTQSDEQPPPPPPVPDGLGERATELWRGIVNSGHYSLRIDELYVLESACREVDLIDRMETEQAGSDLIATGSQGQPVVAPLVPELRQHRAMVAGLMRQLKLPDTDDQRPVLDASNKARMAANVRWGNVTKP